MTINEKLDILLNGAPARIVKVLSSTSSGSYNCSSIEGYQNFDVNNFLIAIRSTRYWSKNVDRYESPTLSYSNGVVTYKGSFGDGSTYALNIYSDVYLVY